MRLGDVLNKLTRKRRADDLINRNEKPAEDIYKPIEHHVDDSSRFKKINEHITAEQGDRQTTEKERMEKRQRFVFVGVGAVVLIIFISLLGVAYTRITNSAFKEDGVNIFIDGPETLALGEEVEYRIIVENKNRTKLTSATVGLNFPNNFEFKKNPLIVDKNLSGIRIDVGEIKGKSKKEYKIKVLAGYSNDTKFLLKAFMRYEPGNVSSFFQVDVTKNVMLKHADISTSIFSAESVSSGELVDLMVVVKNDGQEQYDKLVLKIEYPDGFTFNNSTMEPLDEKHNVWTLDKLNAGAQKEIKILGRLTGRVESMKKFKIVVAKGTENNIIFEGEKSVKIIPSKIILKQESDSSNVYPGSFVDYVISFKNNSSVDLRNLILKVHLPDKFIKRDAVRYDNGYYDSRDNMIIWKAADIDKLKNLQPGEEGSVDFSIRVQEQILSNDEKNKNPYIRIYSEIESLDVDSPIFENKKIISPKMKILVNSMMGVSSSIEYLATDNNGEEEEYLQVDKKMSLRVHLDMNNTTSDLKDVKVIANFPSDISWEKQIYPKGDNLEFNNRSNQMEWRIGSVKSGTGFARPSEKAEFIISVTPSENQSGHEIELINDIKISAVDAFTGNNIEHVFKVVKSSVVEGLKSGVVVATN
jgi:hypothetical protein